MPKISELRGLWRRSLIAWPDGRRDETTCVHWLQGETFYADLRRPAGAPDFSHAGCLNDLTPQDCQWLARQEGFTGVFSYDGTWFEWARRVDYQPVSPYSDSGALHWEGGVLVETGRDVAYIEHWHREVLPQAPVTGLMLEDADSGVAGAFLRVGEMFMLVRDRNVALPARPSLAACVEAAELPAARAMIDCEISFGRYENGVPRIEVSSLPYRAGCEIGMQVAGERLTVTDQDGCGHAIERRWRIVARENEALQRETLEIMR